MNTVLDKQIQDYLPLLGIEEKQSLLSVIKSFLHLKKDNRISIEQYNNELNEAEIEYEKGDAISNDEMKAKIKEWSPRNTK